MQCQGEDCSDAAVAHITEIVDGEPTEMHLCRRHTDEYLARDSRLQEQLREACAASGSG